MKLCFIGFGNMAKAIAHSLYQQDKYQISASSPSLEEGLSPEGLRTYADNTSAVAQADLVILAVKPAKVAEVLESIKTALPQQSLLISVAAGVSLSLLEQHCPTGQAIIRSMPNIPIAIAKGATPLIANARVSQAQRAWAEELFQYSGIISWVSDEQEIDAFTALSGSGPAYVFYFLEAMIDAAVKLGLNAEIAKRFALQTLSGAVELASDSPLAIAELRKKVTSPAGTTAAAITILEQQGFAQLVFEAMNAAHERARKLGG